MQSSFRPPTQLLADVFKVRRLIAVVLVHAVLMTTAGLPGNSTAFGQAERDLPLTRSYRFSHLTAEDGLPSSDITALLQDSLGFVWIGTRNGLSRYDGYELQVFRHDPDDSASLRSNYIQALLEAADGTLWVTTRHGDISRFDPSTASFVHVEIEPAAENRVGDDEFFSSFQDSRGDLWFGGHPRTGLVRYTPATGAVKRFAAAALAPVELAFPPGIWRIAEDADGDLWMGADLGLARYDVDSETFRFYRAPNAEDHRIGALTADGSNGWWVGGSRGLYHFDLATEAFTQVIEGVFIHELMVDRQGVLWMTTAGDGAWRVDPESRQPLAELRYNPRNSQSLLGDVTTALMADREGVVWIGSERGVNLFASGQLAFATYLYDPDDARAPADSTAQAIAGDADGDALWLGSDRTLIHIDRTSGTIERFPLPTGAAAGDGAIQALLQDPRGLVWLGLEDRTLLRFDPATAAFAPFALPPMQPREAQRFIPSPAPNPPQGRPVPPSASSQPAAGDAPAPGPPPLLPELPEVSAIVLDGQDHLWIAIRFDGLYRIDPATDEVTAYPGIRFQRPDPQRPVDDLVSTAATGSDGDVWFGYQNGSVSRYRVQEARFEHYRFVIDKTVPRLSVTVEQIHVDARGIVWLATSNGLYRLDPESRKSRHFGEQAGLPTTRLASILKDNDGALWLGAESGLIRFDPQKENAVFFGADDFLKPGALLNGVARRDVDSRLYFGGEGGLVGVAPARVPPRVPPPAVALTELQRFNQPVPIGPDSLLQAPIWATEALTLDHRDSVISLQFSALSYAAPETLRYRYRLEGLEAGWNEVDASRRFVTYTSLPAGRYTFQAQAQSQEREWGDTATLAVTVVPPWWRTWWFTLLAVGSLAALVAGGVAWRIHAVQQTSRRLQQEVAARTQDLSRRTEQLTQANEQLEVARAQAEAASAAKSDFLANMSHELRTPLNGIMGYAQILQYDDDVTARQREGLQTIYSSGRHLLTLINDILDLAKIEARTLELQPHAVHLTQMLDEVADLMGITARQKGIDFHYVAAPELPAYVVADEKRLRQVLLNLLGNAVKFTETGYVEFSVTPRDGGASRQGAWAGGGEGPSSIRLRFDVADTGPGIAEAELARIFRPFEQSGARGRIREGAGLGLSISQRLVRLMDAEIQVQSRPGEGSRFWFDVTLPHLAGHAPAATDGQVIRGYQGIQRTILVADDQHVNRLLLLDVLAPLGFDVVLAENGQEAVNLARHHRPDAICLDLVMPVMMGVEAARQIHQQPALARTPIIAISASALQIEEAQARQLGFIAFLAKPINADELLRILKAHLQLTWVYDEAPATQAEPSPTPESDGPLQIALPRQSVPPARELEILYELAAFGNMSRVIAHARALQAMAPAYAPFAERVIRLAERFDDEAIQTLIKQKLEGD